MERIMIEFIACISNQWIMIEFKYISTMIWDHLAPSGTPWSHLKPSGTIWNAQGDPKRPCRDP